MIREEWQCYKIFPFDTLQDLHINMELWGVADFDIVETLHGFIAKSNNRIYDKGVHFSTIFKNYHNMTL